MELLVVVEVVGGGGVGSSCVNFCSVEGVQRSIVCLVELLVVVVVAKIVIFAMALDILRV
jgi:hypothetical protein